MIQVEELTEQDVAGLLPKRNPLGNKGDNGRALLLAGSQQYTGAALMSAGAALRCGCGLLTVLSTDAVKAAFCALPEAMCVPVGMQWDRNAVRLAATYLPQAQVLAVGPGMGDGDGVAEMVAMALDTGKPLVLDADGLNAAARKPALLTRLHENCVLTPHMGEMARLLNYSVADIKKDPVKVAQNCARQWHCTVVLKDARSIIACGERVTRNTTGNDGLAKGGSGDVLCGIILALLAQKAAPYDAARVGSYLLGVSAQQALTLLQTRMVMARDLIQVLEQMFQQR